MWVGLVFVACMSAEPGESFQAVAQSPPAVCREFEVIFDGSMMQCMMFGQQRIVHWLDRNEPWQLKGGYRCELGAPT